MRTRTRILNIPWAAAAVAALALASTPAYAAPTVWNVNIGPKITTSDNFVGAAPENTVNSTWNHATPNNPFTSYSIPLADSTGAASTATLSLAGTVDINYSENYPDIAGPDIFDSWSKTSGNATPFTMTIGGLVPGSTYDLIVYSDWHWKGNDWLPVTQTVGSGLTGTVALDQISSGTNGTVPGLVEDTDPSQNGATEGNWLRITGLTPDGSGNLAFSMGGRNIAFNGFQLVQITPPPPATITVFGIPGSAGVIDQVAKTINLTVPFGTDLATLAPTFTIGSGTCDQSSGAPPSPTFAVANPATYTVTDTSTDPDTINAYSVQINVTPVSTACDILTFNANFPGSSAIIATTSPTTGTVAVRVPLGTTESQVAAIEPSYTLSQFATCPQPNPGAPTPALSTTTPVGYLVNAQDGVTTKTYSVSVTVDTPTPPFMALAGDGSTGDLNVYNEADGYRFQTGNTALTVNWLGLFDAPNGEAGTVGDGLVSSHRVSIWLENGGALVAQTTVLTTDGLQGNFRGRNISQVNLLPNTGYVIAADYNGSGDRMREGADPAEWNLNSQISSLAGRYGGPGGGMPPNAWSVMIGPNFGTTPPVPTTTLVIDLGTSPAGTTITGGTFIGTGPTNLPIPTLPVGSILRSIAVNAKLEATTMGSYASELAVLLDPTPGTPGGDYSVEITNGANPFGATVGLDWPGSADAGVGTMLVDTKTAANWSSVFPIDLATTGLFLGNAYIDPGNGTWSGTITLTYDLVAGGVPYAVWSGGAPFDNDENGDGVQNGLAFLLGAADPNENALGRLPNPTKTPSGLKLNFSVRKPANRGTATPTIQWSNDLGLADSWATNLAAVPPSTSVVNGVDFQVDSSGALDAIEATIPSSEGAAGKLFGRLSGESN
jgi:hypothetical protein